MIEMRILTRVSSTALSILKYIASKLRDAQRALLKPLQNQAHTFKWVP